MNIPFIDINRQHQILGKELKDAFARILQSGKFVLSEELKAFEKEMADYVGCKYAFGAANGTTALTLCLEAMDIRPGDEVITTPFTFFATAEVIAKLGAVPVFCDIEADTLNIDPHKIPALITKKTRAVMPVHIFGQIADMDSINKIARQNQLIVIEDAAQAFGAVYKGKKACALGDLSGVSFYPTKNLNALGDGGIVFTNHDAYADKIRSLRVHGSKQKYYHEILGYNDRLDDLQAAFLRIKLQYLDGWNKRRREIAKKYDERIRNYVKVPFIATHNETIYHQYTIRTEKRNELQKFLKDRGVATDIHYPLPLHLQPALSYLKYRMGSLPIAEAVSREVLSLPIFQDLTDGEVDYVIDSVLSFFK